MLLRYVIDKHNLYCVNLLGHPLGKRRDSVVNGAYLLRTALLVRAMTHAYTKTVLTPQGFRLYGRLQFVASTAERHVGLPDYSAECANRPIGLCSPK